MLFLSVLCKIKLVLVLCGRVIINHQRSIEKENYANQKEEELKRRKRNKRREM